MRAETRRRIGHLVAALAVAAGVAGGVAVLVARSGTPPEGPVEVAWDRHACARCGMLVSEPSFAAQLHTADGAVHYFDDPGCLLLWRAAHDPEVHATWFHHVDEERWLSGAAVGFVEASPTPMGYGLGAVEAGRSGALSPAEALERARRRDRRGREGAP